MSRTFRVSPVTHSLKPDSQVERDTTSRTYRTHRDGSVTFDWSDERTSDKRAFSKARRRGDAVVVRSLLDEMYEDDFETVRELTDAYDDYEYEPYWEFGSQPYDDWVDARIDMEEREEQAYLGLL